MHDQIEYFLFVGIFNVCFDPMANTNKKNFFFLFKF